MKAIMFSALSISSGYRNVMIAGGMESMSNIPYYLPGARNGYRLGHQTVVDGNLLYLHLISLCQSISCTALHSVGLIADGLWDIYSNQHMGMCGELCADQYGFTREDQDEYAIRSYQRSAKAWEMVNTLCHCHIHLMFVKWI
jgi:acetyl-CoA C-acetyltransferase